MLLFLPTPFPSLRCLAAFQQEIVRQWMSSISMSIGMEKERGGGGDVGRTPSLMDNISGRHEKEHEFPTRKEGRKQSNKVKSLKREKQDEEEQGRTD